MARDIDYAKILAAIFLALDRPDARNSPRN